MKFGLVTYVCCAVAALAISFSFIVIPGNLKKAFKSLEVYNYFEAKARFYKALKKDSVPSAYGLSIIYGRNDNPFFSPDSAQKFIYRAENLFPSLTSKTRQQYSELGMDSLALVHQRERIDSIQFKRGIVEANLAVWKEFITNHSTEKYVRMATVLRDSLAFDIAEKSNSSEAYASFATTYADAEQTEDAWRRYHKRLYAEKTSEKQLREYQDFVKEYPDSPYAQDAAYRIYEKYEEQQTPEALEQFIEENPDNVNIATAWRRIYLMEIGELSAKSIAAFTLKYPDYPFEEELQQDFAYATTRYYPISTDSLWGFVDENGNIRVEPIYSWVEEFSEGMAAVGKNTNVAFIDKSGREITPFEFQDAFAFNNGFAVIEKDEKFGVINRLGNWIIAAEYDDLGEYSQGYFYAFNGESYGYFNDKGELVIPFSFDDATDFKNGRAIVEKDGLFGLIDKMGAQIADFENDWIEPFQNDHRPVRFKRGDYYGLMDEAGAQTVLPIYDNIGDLSEGLALAALGDTYGFISYSGDTIIPFQYTFSQDALKNGVFNDGYAKVYYKDKLGVIDSTGTKVLPAMFDDVGQFRGQLIPVKKKGKWGFANRAVDLVLPYIYETAENFINGFAIVSKNDQFGVIDMSGKIQVPLKYNYMSWVDSMLIVGDTLQGIIDLDGQEWVPLVYDKAEKIDTHVIRFYDDQGIAAYYDYRKRKMIWRKSSLAGLKES